MKYFITIILVSVSLQTHTTFANEQKKFALVLLEDHSIDPQPLIVPELIKHYDNQLKLGYNKGYNSGYNIGYKIGRLIKQLMEDDDDDDDDWY